MGGSKKTAFDNFSEIAKMLHRQPKHLLAFLFAELGTSGAIDGSNQLIMKGNYGIFLVFCQALRSTWADELRTDVNYYKKGILFCQKRKTKTERKTKERERPKREKDQRERKTKERERPKRERKTREREKDQRERERKIKERERERSKGERAKREKDQREED